MAVSGDGRSATRATIVDVATRLLQEHGPRGVTTRAVAEAAGVQAPAIYRLFGDKDGLLEAVAEQVMSTYAATKAGIVGAAAAEGADPLHDLRAGWDTHIAFGLANPSVFGLLSDPDRARDSAAARSGKRVLALRVRRVAASGRLRVSEQRAVDLIHAAGLGVIQTLLAMPPEGRDPGLAEAMYETVLRHILADAPALPDDATMSATVAFRAVAPRLDALSDAERRLMTEWLDRAIDANQAVATGRRLPN